MASRLALGIPPLSHPRPACPGLLVPHKPRVQLLVPAAAQQPSGTSTHSTLKSLDELLPVEPEPAAPPPTRAARGFRRQAMSQQPANFIGLDDRYFPNDPHGLDTGLLAADDASELPLPVCEPVVSRALAAGVVLSWLAGTVAPSVIEGPVGLLNSALSLLSFDAVGTAAAAGALALVGSEQERVLGRGRFAAYWFLTSASKSGVSIVDAAMHGGTSDQDWGPAAPVLGVSCAAAAYCAVNWRTLSARQRLTTLSAAAAAAAACLAAEWPYVDGSFLAPALTGLALGWWSGPKYLTMREPLIPDMSITVPEDGEHVRCVVDTRSGWRSHGACLAVAVAILAATKGGIWLLGDDMMKTEELQAGLQTELLNSRELQRELMSPEVTNDLQKAAPDLWRRTL